MKERYEKGELAEWVDARQREARVNEALGAWLTARRQALEDLFWKQDREKIVVDIPQYNTVDSFSNEETGKNVQVLSRTTLLSCCPMEDMFVEFAETVFNEAALTRVDVPDLSFANCEKTREENKALRKGVELVPKRVQQLTNAAIGVRDRLLKLFPDHVGVLDDIHFYGGMGLIKRLMYLLGFTPGQGSMPRLLDDKKTGRVLLGDDLNIFESWIPGQEWLLRNITVSDSFAMLLYVENDTETLYRCPREYVNTFMVGALGKLPISNLYEAKQVALQLALGKKVPGASFRLVPKLFPDPKKAWVQEYLSLRIDKDHSLLLPIRGLKTPHLTKELYVRLEKFWEPVPVESMRLDKDGEKVVWQRLSGSGPNASGQYYSLGDHMEDIEVCSTFITGEYGGSLTLYLLNRRLSKVFQLKEDGKFHKSTLIKQYWRTWQKLASEQKSSFFLKWTSQDQKKDTWSHESEVKCEFHLGWPIPQSIEWLEDAQWEWKESYVMSFSNGSVPPPKVVVVKPDCRRRVYNPDLGIWQYAKKEDLVWKKTIANLSVDALALLPRNKRQRFGFVTDMLEGSKMWTWVDPDRVGPEDIVVSRSLVGGVQRIAPGEYLNNRDWCRRILYVGSVAEARAFATILGADFYMPYRLPGNVEVTEIVPGGTRLERAHPSLDGCL